MLELIPIFETVSREQIVKLQEDMSRRLAFMNCSERTAHYYRSWNLMRMGDYDLALDYQQQYLAMRRDSMSDCAACERDRQIELLVRMHADQPALDCAEPVLYGMMHCGEVPHFTNGHVVKSMARLAKDEEAVRLSEKDTNSSSRIASTWVPSAICC